MEAIAGEEFDRRIEREVLFRRSGDRLPRFSSDERAAVELAAEVSRRTGWKIHLSQSGGTWNATWIEDRRRQPGDARRRKIGALVTATGPTQSLAICRALLKAARLPRWPLAPRARRTSRARIGQRATAIAAG